MSLPEVLLWQELRREACGVRVRRQHPLGPYVLDFYIPAARLAVEVDGRSHDLSVKSDARRDEFLAKAGVRVLRIAASDVLKNPEACALWVASVGKQISGE